MTATNAESWQWRFAEDRTRRSLLRWTVFATLALIPILSEGFRTIAAEKDLPQAVTLVIDYGDGAEKRLTNIPWTEDLTVLDVMEYAAKHRHGIKFTFRGKGATSFLKSIDDQENEGATGRNWIFHINEKQGTESFALSRLRAGDTVLWKFDSYP